MFYQETCERCCEDKVESWYSGGKIDEGALAGGYINQIKTVALCSIEPCQIWPVNAIYTVLHEFPLMWQSCFCIALMKYETTLSSPRTITANCPADDNPVLSNHKTESTSCFLASRSTSLKMKICFSFLRGRRAAGAKEVKKTGTISAAGWRMIQSWKSSKVKNIFTRICTKSVLQYEYLWTVDFGTEVHKWTINS